MNVILLTCKLREWVMIDMIVVKNDRCQKFKSKINDCINQSLAALFSLLYSSAELTTK